MNKFKRVAVVGIGFLAFSGIAVGGAQAAEKPPAGKEYTVTGVSSCAEAVKKSVREYGTPTDWRQYSCMMHANNKAADLVWHKA